MTRSLVPTYILLNLAALLALIICAVLMIVRWRRRLRRLEDEVREVRRQIEAKRRELEEERKRAEWKERKWRKFGGEWD